MIEEGLGFVLEPAGDVGGDPAVGGSPEGVAIGKGFGGNDVEEGGGEVYVEGLDKGGLVDGVAAADVSEGCAGLHGVELLLAENEFGGGV